jgi:hypothetical protein
MREMELGMKIDMKAGPTFFGMEQVNAALKAGARVVSVSEGSVITSKVGEDAENVEMAVTGFSVKLAVDEFSASKQAARPWWRFW